MIPYDPFDWYWIVGGERVFSSAAATYVLADNAAYLAWTASGGIPTAIASEAELGEVLAPLNIRPTPVNVLDAYQDTQARILTVEVVAKVLFKLVNEICVLKGQQQITAAQFRAYVKGLM